MMEKVPMTASGYAALEVELKQRQSVERPRIIEHIAEARSHGDLSENAEYHAAKEEQSHNEGRIAELEDKLARADVIDISKLSGDTIKFGATVIEVGPSTPAAGAGLQPGTRRLDHHRRDSHRGSKRCRNSGRRGQRSRRSHDSCGGGAD